MSLQVLNTAKLMAIIFQMSSMSTLAAFRGTSHTFADMIISFLGHRVRSTLLRYLPQAALGPFIALLKHTRAGVVGSVATTIYCVDIYLAHTPNNINLLIPYDLFNTWASWLTSHGAVPVLTLHCDDRFLSSVGVFGAFLWFNGQGKEARQKLTCLDALPYSF